VRAKTTFVMFLDNHHGDGRLTIWCAAPGGMQNAAAGSSQASGRVS
jgi:hypothetical protein